MTRAKLAATAAVATLTVAAAAFAIAGQRPAAPPAASTAVIMHAPSPPPASEPSASLFDRLFRTVSDREDDHRTLESYVEAQDGNEQKAGQGGQDGGRRPGGPREREGRGRGIMMGPMAFVGFCGPEGGRVVDFALRRLEQLSSPTDAQKPAFEKLKEATSKARETAQAGCPAEQPVTPSGRLAAAEKRLEAMLAAIKIVRPAVDEFFAGLSEEQEARVYAASGRRMMGRDDGERGRRWRRWREREGGPREGRRGPRDMHFGGDTPRGWSGHL